MKPTGITRPVDSLGRVVIPKAIRDNLGIIEGDLLEISLDENSNIILTRIEALTAEKRLAHAVEYLSGCAEMLQDSKSDTLTQTIAKQKIAQIHELLKGCDTVFSDLEDTI